MNPSDPNSTLGHEMPGRPHAAAVPEVEVALATWRAQAAACTTTQVFFIEALARRAAQHQGVTRQHLNQKLLLALAASVRDGPAALARSRTPAPAQQAGTLSALSALRHQLDTRAAMPCRTAWRAQSLAGLRATWCQLHAQKRVAQALASKPPQAGPLNSEQLVHRALLLMRDVSPDYLRHLVSTVDGLASGVQLQQAGAVSTPTAPHRSKPSRVKA